MKKRRDIFLAVSLLLLLVLLTILAGLYQSKQDQVAPLSSSSNLPDGARAMRIWLEQMGYTVSSHALAKFAIPEQTQAVLILEPSFAYNITGEEWDTLEDWVSHGGVLFLASRNLGMALNGSTLDLTTVPASTRPGDFTTPVPVLRYPPLVQPVKMSGWTLLKPDRENLIPLLSSADGAAAAEMIVGQGKMILVADTDFLTNAGLKDPLSAALALNLFTALPTEGAIWIDEWHHGVRAEENTPGGPEAWLQNTPSGRAVLFSAALIFLALLLAGRPFGRPVPLPRDLVRRAPLEHVTALANLNRRAGHRRALMQSYRAGLKRAYGRRYRLDPGLPDEEYVARLSTYNPELDAPALLDLLKRLNSRGFSEAQMVQLAREAARWMKPVEHENTLSGRG